MSNQFLRTSWTTYLGELRPIWDIKVKSSEPGCYFSGTARYDENAPTPTATATPPVTPTMTQTPSQTQTGTPNPTSTPTNTPTNTQTSTSTPNPTSSPTPSITASSTPPVTPTSTSTPTSTAQVTPTPTNTSTPTNTLTATNTPSPTQTGTAVITPTPSITPSATPTTPPFSPSSVPNLFQWFDASNSSSYSTRTVGSQTYVTSWTGTAGSTLTQPTQSYQPQLIQGAHGFPYSGVSFVGADIALSGTTSGSVPSGNTTFIVSYNPTDTNSMEFSVDTNNGEGISSQYNNNNIAETRTPFYKVAWNGWTSVQYYPNSFLAVTGNSVSAGGTLNDNPHDTTSSFTPGSTMTRVRISDIAADSNGTIFEIVVYNRVLNQTEYNNVTNYLKNKWNYAVFSATPTPTPTVSITPSPTATPVLYQYWNVEAYGRTTCTLATTGVLKIYTGGGASPQTNRFYCNSASLYKYKPVSQTTPQAFIEELNPPYASSTSCSGVSCI
jgi:hypothetical protein